MQPVDYVIFIFFCNSFGNGWKKLRKVTFIESCQFSLKLPTLLELNKKQKVQQQLELKTKNAWIRINNLLEIQKKVLRNPNFLFEPSIVIVPKINLSVG